MTIQVLRIKNKPLSVKFAHSCDMAMVKFSVTSTIISKVEHPKVFINPFMSIAERKYSSRRAEPLLIEESRESSFNLLTVKIQFSYIDKTKVSSANEDNFVQHQQPQINYSPESMSGPQTRNS